MMLLLALGPASPPQVSLSCSIGFVYKFIRCSTIPGVNSELNLRVNLFGTSVKLGALQDNLLKNNHFLGVPFPNSYAVELH